jgi:hypothetical protein
LIEASRVFKQILIFINENDQLKPEQKPSTGQISYKDLLKKFSEMPPSADTRPNGASSVARSNTIGTNLNSAAESKHPFIANKPKPPPIPPKPKFTKPPGYTPNNHPSTYTREKSIRHS